jgi:hypothetical protein
MYSVCPFQSLRFLFFVTKPACTSVDSTYTVIGLSRIPVTSSNLTGLSWTEGVAVDSLNATRNFEKNFYLATPPTTNISSIGACTVFFNNVSDIVKFPGNDITTSQGQCHDAMGSSCVSALTKRATDLDVSGLGVQAACAKLLSAFEDNLDGDCAAAATSSKWQGLTVRGMCCE